ncbi:MAG: hypothetical protein EOO01_17760 [Chitinophagaceae bacterium]|nr:MAG: hypothetical protein EOO01_17760 [Chitinophagaceae bacterium]
MYKKFRLLAFIFLSGVAVASGQTENSPYSRYGLGDQMRTQNIINRGMGGFSAAYGDYQSVNFTNPASYGRIKATVLDIGVEVNTSTMRALNPPRKFSSASPNISYVTVGIPLSRKRDWGVVVGLRPMSRISYQLERNERNTSGTLNDSINSIFRGEGGTQQVFIGMGFGVKNLRLGINAGYLFGSKDYSTRTTFINDSVLYYRSLHGTTTNFGGLLLNGGLQYTIKLNKDTRLHAGAFGSLKQTMKGNRTILRETFVPTAEDEPQRVDSVSTQKDIRGDMIYPASYGFGLMLDRESKWMIGADFTQTNWNDYRFFGEKDFVQNSWKVHVGGQIIPNALNGKNYWNRVAYRAGFNYGTDYVNVDGDMPTYAVTFGMGLPMRPPAYTKQFAVINLGLEYGRRGDKNSTVRESFFAISLGLNLSDIWFQKRKYY